ncbi:MAG: hypothetical protein ACODAD_10680, partial [Planctomycetota bacterium]
PMLWPWLVILQAIGFFRVQRCPTPAVLPLVGLAAEKAIRDRYSCTATVRYVSKAAPSRWGQYSLPPRRWLIGPIQVALSD